MIQALIYKAELTLLSDTVVKDVTPGGAAHLRMNSDKSISVIFKRPVKFPLSLLKRSIINIGSLPTKAVEIVSPAFEKGVVLRVRVVEVEPAHMRPKRGAAIFVSIWGEPKDIEPQRFRYSIFSQSKINDLVDETDRR